MKKIIGLALILALGFQFLMKLGIITYFQLNQTYIIEQFCVNKEKPQLNCDGQCFLSKKLQSVDDGENEPERSGTSNQQLEIPAFLVAMPNVISFKIEEPAIEMLLFVNHYAFFRLTSHFHPPEFIS